MDDLDEFTAQLREDAASLLRVAAGVTPALPLKVLAPELARRIERAADELDRLRDAPPTS